MCLRILYKSISFLMGIGFCVGLSSEVSRPQLSCVFGQPQHTSLCTTHAQRQKTWNAVSALHYTVSGLAAHLHMHYDGQNSRIGIWTWCLKLLRIWVSNQNEASFCVPLVIHEISFRNPQENKSVISRQYQDRTEFFFITLFWEETRTLKTESWTEDQKPSLLHAFTKCFCCQTEDCLCWKSLPWMCFQTASFVYPCSFALKESWILVFGRGLNRNPRSVLCICL